MVGSVRVKVATGVGVAAFVLFAGLAWACVGVVSLTTAEESIRAGGTLTVTGREFARGVPIEIRLDSVTGPVLGTVPPPTTTMNSSWTQTVTLPADISDGPHFLVALQDHHDMNSGQPARAAFFVGDPPPEADEPAERPALLSVSSGPGAAVLVLVGLGFAALGLLAAAGWSLLVARRSPSSGSPSSPARGA